VAGARARRGVSGRAEPTRSADQLAALDVLLSLAEPVGSAGNGQSTTSAVAVLSAPAQPADTRPEVLPAQSARVGARANLDSLVIRFAASRWFLPAVIGVQALLSLRLIWSNTAFNDEALYLWSGHWEIAHILDRAVIPQFQRYFSGAPVIYPVIGAVADSYGGLTLARLLSLAFMLGTTAVLYSATARLFDRRAARCAVVVFAFLGPVQFLGSFATYDAMAIFLLALASWLVICADGKFSEPRLVLAAFVLAFADATKYATGLWDPVVVLLAAFAPETGGWLRRSLRATRVAVYISAIIGGLLMLGGSSYVAGILFTTLARQPGTVSFGGVLKDAAPWIGIVLLLAMRSVVLVRGRRMQLLCATLAAAVLLAPLEEAHIHTSVSLQKHVAFGAWFGAIAAGYVLARAVETSKYAKWRIVAATAALVAVTGFFQSTTFDHRWPDSTRATNAMRRIAKGVRGPILAEQEEVFRYYLQLPPSQTHTLKGFYFWDVHKAKYFTGTAALGLAIHQHYFAIIELDYTFPDDARYEAAVLTAVRATPGYHIVARIPWRDGSSHSFFTIWRYTPLR
jgi:Dolichyl-phosphate-mannose-protein mannosyltransferase